MVVIPAHCIGRALNMRKLILLVLLLETGVTLRAQSGRFVVDDDSYTAQVVLAGEKLLRENKLVSLDSLRSRFEQRRLR
jgi:hypothetical protein